MRQRQKQVTGSLKELETFARKENIPIIPHETVAYFRFLMETMQPKNILEIGTAIGFSALLMAEHAPDAKITTIDRNPEMIGFAKENFAQFDSRKQITLLGGRCSRCFIYSDRNLWLCLYGLGQVQVYRLSAWNL